MMSDKFQDQINLTNYMPSKEICGISTSHTGTILVTEQRSVKEYGVNRIKYIFLGVKFYFRLNKPWYWFT